MVHERVNHPMDPSLPMTRKRMTLIFILHMNRILYNNQFDGTLPSFIGELTRLEYLYVHQDAVHELVNHLLRSCSLQEQEQT